MNNNIEKLYNDSTLDRAWFNYWVNHLEELKSKKRTTLELNPRLEKVLSFGLLSGKKDDAIKGF